MWFGKLCLWLVYIEKNVCKPYLEIFAKTKPLLCCNVREQY
jgi:hypothetical protein